MKGIKTGVVSVRMDAVVIERLGDLAKRAGLSKNQLASNLLTQGVECLSRADKIGLVGLAVLLRDYEMGLKSWLQRIKDEGKSVNLDWLNGCFDEAFEASKNET
jgi:hypothetical protein